MKFGLVEIRATSKGWKVSFAELSGDYYPPQLVKPSGQGYYYYPKRKGLKKAFTELKECLIQHHKEEIKRLQKSLDKLEALELENTKCWKTFLKRKK